MHPKIQSRLRDDIRRHLAEAGTANHVDSTVMDSMEYLSAVCEEVLRIFPTVPVTARQAIRETTIGDQIVPKGTFVIICPWGTNRLPSIWGPDAHVLNPDRWMCEGKSNFGGAGTPYGKITFL